MLFKRPGLLVEKKEAEIRKTPLNNKTAQHRRLSLQNKTTYEANSTNSNVCSNSRITKAPKKIIIYNSSNGKTRHTRTRSTNMPSNNISLSLTKTFFHIERPLGSFTALHSKRPSIMFNEEGDGLKKSRELLSKAKESIHKKDYKTCIGFLNGSIELSRGNLDALYLRGMAYYEVAQFDKSLKDFQSIIDVNPNFNKRVFIYCAKDQLKMNEPQKALGTVIF